MSDIVNLRTARKQRRRAQERAQAAARAAASGERASAKALREAEAAKDRRRLDLHRIDRPSDDRAKDQ